MPASIFPPIPLTEALVIAATIVKENAGKPMRRLTIFDLLGRSPSSSSSRQLVTASSGYGLTQGGYTAEIIALTERGKAIVVNNDPKAKIDAVLGIPLFKSFFDNYRNATLPSPSAAMDFLIARGVNGSGVRNCLDLIIKNGETVSLIQEISGSKRIVSPEHALEKMGMSTAITSLVEDEKSIEGSPQKNGSTSNDGPKSEIIDVVGKTAPSIHIDIQIHISADSSSEQIDQVFASMAKHLYPAKDH